MVERILRPLILGTRSSKLALWQSENIRQMLQSVWDGLEIRLITMQTEGDRNLDRSLPEIGGKGLFTLDLEQALLDGKIDLAVHSLKDLPVEEAQGITVGAISKRADARDAWISPSGKSLRELSPDSVVGTSSVRRAAQLLALRPDLIVKPIRGNVDTRIRKVQQGDFDAVILAAAGLQRLGMDEYITAYIPFEQMLPAPGQGALAVQCRAGDNELLDVLKSIDDLPARRAVTAERVFLSTLGGGCSAPVAAYAVENGRTLKMDGLVASTDGQNLIRVYGEDTDPQKLGAALAEHALSQGAERLMV
jgi:hydroxymethylbilane synthase